VKPNTPSFEVHPQLSNKENPVDGALVGAGSLQHLQTNPDVLVFYPSPHPNTSRFSNKSSARRGYEIV
jgi:hypothetical protein